MTEYFNHCSNCRHHPDNGSTNTDACMVCIASTFRDEKPSEWKPIISEDEIVSHPQHYQSEKGLETIDVIEAFTADLKGIEAVDTGNVIKYICRWKNKNGVQDLKKAEWYLNHLINHLEKESN